MSRRARPLPALVLISGRGSNMQAIVQRARAPHSSFDVRAVLSDRADAPGLAIARGLGIEAQAVTPEAGVPRLEYDRWLAAQIERLAPGLVVLAGFMRILGPAFVRRFAGRMLNVHPSLLPRFRGLDTHRRVLEAGEHEHGASVHFVTEELDGGPVVIQGRVPVLGDDTVATLSARVQAIEHRIYPQTVQWFAEGRLEQRGEQAYFDGRALLEPLGTEALKENSC
jgi:phosphoribosylglycinamide formyltransferase 1